jgi:flagellar basal body-associated protein FliL
VEDTPETPSETLDTAVEPSIEMLRAKAAKAPPTREMRADPISKKLILLSKLFASLALICIGFLTFIYHQKKHAHDGTGAEDIAIKLPIIFSQTLDGIHVKLKNEQDLRAEIAVECATRETCNFIKDNPTQVRDLVIPVLNSIDSDQFSNIENKRLVRKKITDRINTLRMPGRVIQVHFVNLSIEGLPN